MTRKKADELVLKKWEWLAKNSDPKKDESENTDAVLKEIPQLKAIRNGCSYCYLYMDGYCMKCPIFKYDKAEDCTEYDSTYYKWGRHCTKANAKKMLALIKKVIARSSKKIAR